MTCLFKPYVPAGEVTRPGDDRCTARRPDEVHALRHTHEQTRFVVAGVCLHHPHRRDDDFLVRLLTASPRLLFVLSTR